MESTAKYLELFKPAASDWFARVTFVRDNFEFFREFFKRENIERAEWADIQEIGKHLHCFQSMAIARGNALGHPNHPIEHYRKSFLYLAHGPGEPAERVRQFHRADEYRLNFFGESAVSELVGYLFPDRFLFWNERDRFAMRFLGIEMKKVRGSDLVSRLEAVNTATRQLAEWYLSIVGKQTNLPLNLELDQFFSWLYETFSNKKGESKSELETAKPNVGPKERPTKYWTYSPGKNGDHWEEFYEQGIIAIGYDGTTDLRGFKDKEEIGRQLQELRPGDSAMSNAALACWQFAHEINKGDIVFAKQGSSRLLGYGLVEGDYVYDPTRSDFRHVRKMKWLAKGEWRVSKDFRMPLKTLTDITRNPDDVMRIEETVGIRGIIAHELEKASAHVAQPTPYTRADGMAGLFLSESQFDDMLDALKEKKNIVLQGAPGVGKTYVAKRLAYTLIGSDDAERVEMIQFHQSYSYEDFIQGFRPTPKGHFDLKHGIFYQFCRKAQRHEQEKEPYVFIIDEINRGNLSRIFGELMMLIEPDKRGEDHAIPLAYSQNADETFYIPENVHFIGTMNTADRSLAMVDYALRRRFRFITLRPEFGSKGFYDFAVTSGIEPALVKKIVVRMEALNEAVAADVKNLGPAYLIGHSFFCPRNAVKPDEAWYRRVVESEIVPLIQEYWFDNDQKVKEQRSALLG